MNYYYALIIAFLPFLLWASYQLLPFLPKNKLVKKQLDPNKRYLTEYDLLFIHWFEEWSGSRFIRRENPDIFKRNNEIRVGSVARTDPVTGKWYRP